MGVLLNEPAGIIPPEFRGQGPVGGNKESQSKSRSLRLGAAEDPLRGQTAARGPDGSARMESPGKKGRQDAKTVRTWAQPGAPLQNPKKDSSPCLLAAGRLGMAVCDCETCAGVGAGKNGACAGCSRVVPLANKRRTT